MVLTLYGIPPSPPARSVDLVIHALGLKAENKTVNLWEKEHLQPEFIKVNPLHTVPAIDDGGFVLWESRAIMTYLVSKYGKSDSLYPKDLQKRAIVDQRLHYSNDCFFVIKYITKGLLWEEKKPSEEWVEKMKECQENIEKLLEGNKFMAGDTLTLADYSFITMVDVLELYSPTKGKFPLTAAWQQRCRTSMADFDRVNSPGASTLKDEITARLAK